jgi:hypothetical protein
VREFWWRLPGLRELSPLRKGVIEAIAVIGLCAVVSFPFFWAYAAAPGETFGDIAQIGATLLVAYAVETSWWLKTSRKRGARRENWVGFVVGIGLGGFLGIASAVALSAHDGSLNWIEAFGLAWSAVSLLLLGLLVATLPLLIYEWTHYLQTDNPDE